MGVGEVFITAGQSNAANAGVLDPTYQVNDRISSFNGSQWAAGANPLPFAQGSGGNIWVYMANRLVRDWNVPIGIDPIAWGAVGVETWQPGVMLPDTGGVENFARLTQAILSLQSRGGVRAVLWQQGEADRFTGPATYESLLSNVIETSRLVTGLNTAWVIALSSYIPGDTPLQPGQNPLDPTIDPQSIRLGQYAVTRTLPNVYLGPSTDDLGPDYRDPDYHIHFNVVGLNIVGSRWAEVLEQTPQLITES
ncbi:MAG: hypothetical protein JO034_10230 [Singulisphaera sp.]|nr:hypothetical protein [Singulisphaera sp.]